MLGTPGGSVASLQSTFGGRAAVGQSGEVRTAKVIDPHCQRGGPTVLHDLRLPIAGMDLNIDHIVVSGNRVTILDTKSWKPGTIWTFRGQTRRGLKRFTPADKQTMKMATQAIAALLQASPNSVAFTMQEPIVVIWSSNKSRRMSVSWYRPIGAKAVRGDVFTRHLRHYVGVVPADPNVVRALAPLLIREDTGPHLRSPLEIESDSF